MSADKNHWRKPADPYNDKQDYRQDQLFIAADRDRRHRGCRPFFPASAATASPASCELGDYRPSVRPNPDGAPTPVSLGLALMDLIAISDSDQVARMNVLLTVEWADHRLQPFSGCRYSVSDIWTPEFQLVNSGAVDTRRPIELVVRDGGLVQGRFRFEGAYSSPWNMSRFPFDSHEIALLLVSQQYSAAEILFQVNETWTGRREMLTIPDWEVGAPVAEVYSRVLPVLEHEASIYEFRIPVARQSEYYVFKFVFPLCLIVMMSWAIFWVSPSNLGPQVSLSATSMLTVVAYQFTMNGLLPKVGYLTSMDKYVLASSILVFLALVEAITAGTMASAGNIRSAEKLDRASRWLFPGAYLVIVLLTLVY